MKSSSALVLLLVAVLGFVGLGSALAQSPKVPNDPQPIYEVFGGTPIPPVEEPVTLKSDYGGLKPGAGREETFYACAGCHSVGRIKRSNMSREDWVATLDRLTAERNLPEFDESERQIIFDYLTENYGPKR